MCGLHRHYAVSPATFAALVAFQHACRCLPIQPRHTRGYLRFVEIAHLGLLLKLANDISNGCGLHFWAIALGMLLLPSCAVVLLMQMASHDVNMLNCIVWVDLHCQRDACVQQGEDVLMQFATHQHTLSRWSSTTAFPMLCYCITTSFPFMQCFDPAC